MAQNLKYPVYQPSFLGKEKEYVNECLDTGWISSKGEFVGKFEKSFANYVSLPFATSTCNGTVSLQIAILALGIKPGDEVIVPTFSYIACVNTIKHVGAIPVFCDSVYSSWQMDPADVAKKITSKTKAIMVVHLYGQACEMEALQAICQKHKLLMIEDCAEAIGSRYKGKHVGTFGDIASFSFFGNKTITTGEGGMLLSANNELIELCSHLKNQGVSNIKTYWHDTIAYNFRMTNLCAAIGLAQLEQIDYFLQEKRRIANRYAEAFAKVSEIEFQGEAPDTFHSYWMNSILIKNAELRDSLRNYLLEYGIETRPLFYPVHTMDIYTEYANANYPVACDLASRGINLPSYPGLTNEDVEIISGKVVEFLKLND